jgi:hypothetical protein
MYDVRESLESGEPEREVLAMSSYKPRALHAVSILYMLAKDDCSLEACTVYMTAAEHIAPEIFEEETMPGADDTRGRTAVGVGSPTISIKA